MKGGFELELLIRLAVSAYLGYNRVIPQRHMQTAFKLKLFFFQLQNRNLIFEVGMQLCFDAAHFNSNFQIFWAFAVSSHYSFLLNINENSNQNLR